MDAAHSRRVLEHIGVPSEVAGIAAYILFFERVRAEGGVAILKLDGQRGPGDNGPYTVVITSERLRHGHVRRDAETLDGAMDFCIATYGYEVWGIPMPSRS